jgi:hypothetical protein
MIILHPVTITTLYMILRGVLIKQVNMPITYIGNSHLFLHYSPGSKILILCAFVPLCLYPVYQVIP